jgi:hypothetical protein
LREFQALLSFDGNTEHLLVAIGYENPDPAGGLAWLMPFPSPPDAIEGSDDGLEAAFDLSAPPLRSEHVPSVVPLLCACGADTDDTRAGGVSLLDRTRVGNLELETLSADDATDLERYLTANRFGFHDRQRDVVESYLDKDWVFVAAKMADDVQAEAVALTPVLFSFTTSEPVYPLAIAGSDHEGEPLRMSLLTVTPTRPEPEGYPSRIVEPDEDGIFAEPEGLEIRFSDRLTSAEARSIDVSVPAQAGGWLTRFEASFDQRLLTSDLTLQEADAQQPLDYDEWIESYGSDRVIARAGQVMFTFVLVTPVVLAAAGWVVLVAGLVGGGFRRARR